MPVSLGLGLNLTALPYASTPAAFTPAALGAKLLGWWNADRADLITIATGVSSWKDIVAGLDAVNATGTQQPIYSATSFNGNPGVTFDGVDDRLVAVTQPFPAVAAPSEIWALAQNNGIGDAAVRTIISYGGATLATSRSVGKIDSAGTDRGAATSNNVVASDTLINLNSRHVLRAQFTATDETITVDGGTPVTSAVVSSTGTTSVRLGCNTNAGTPQRFWSGPVREIIVTDGTLTAGEVTSLQTYMLARR